MSGGFGTVAALLAALSAAACAGRGPAEEPSSADLGPILSAPAPARASYVNDAVLLQACVKLGGADRDACGRLRTLAGDDGVRACERVARHFGFRLAARTSSREALEACRAWMADPEGPEIVREIPASRVDELCGLFSSGLDGDQILAAARRLAPAPLSERAERGLRHGIDYARPGYRCGPSDSPLCPDLVATAAAARSGGAAACGDSPFCRAALGGGREACRPLLSRLRADYAAWSGAPPEAPAGPGGPRR